MLADHPLWLLVGQAVVVGVFGPTANGDRFALFQILDATLASTVIVLLLIALTRNRLPWRGLPESDNGDAPGSSPARPDAYAESP